MAFRTTTEATVGQEPETGQVAASANPGEQTVKICDLPYVIRHMAVTGDLTNACLAAGALPMPVHFYSPVPDIADLDSRRVWDRRSRLEGIDFRPEAQVELMRELGRRHGAECQWPLTDTGDPTVSSRTAAASASSALRPCIA